MFWSTGHEHFHFVSEYREPLLLASQLSSPSQTGGEVDLAGASVKLTISDVPPSLNKVLRMHWTSKSELRGDWDLYVRSQMTEPISGATVKMRCRITLAHSRFYDKDNAYGACKPVVDALKFWKLILDDTAEWLDLSVEQQKCPHKQRHTIVELEPA